MMDSPVISLKKLQEELHTTVFNQNISLNIISNLYEKFCNYFNHCEKVVSEDIKVLANCCLKFIDCIRNHVDNTPIHGKVYIARVEEFVSIIENASQLENIRDDYVIYITVPILEKVIEPDIIIWFSKELLKSFNLAVRGTRRYIRHRIVENSTLLLCKLADLVCTCGDYDYQVLLLEAIFNLCSEGQIKKYASELFPTSSKFQDKFCDINRKCFDKDVRTFLNMVNSDLKKVISVKCEGVQLGDIKIVAPKFPDLEELPVWTDFNLGTRTITIFCDKDSFTTNLSMENSNDDEKIELLTINVEDISNVFASRLILPESSFSLGSIVLFNMTGSCSLMNSYSVNATKATHLKLAIYKCTELTELLEEVLPNWFGANFKHKPENYWKLDQPSRKKLYIGKKCEDKKALPHNLTVNSKEESLATPALHQLQTSKAVSELCPKNINIDSKQKAYKPVQNYDNSNESNVNQAKVSVLSFGDSCQKRHKSTVISRIQFANKLEYKSLPIDNSSTSMKSRSTGALSSISSTSDAQSLKDRLHAHQPANFLKAEKSRISKSPKIHNIEQLKEIAADPEYSVLAKKQEDSRILTKEIDILTEPELLASCLFSPKKMKLPSPISAKKSIYSDFSNRAVSADDLALKENASNNNCQTSGKTEGNQKSQMKVQEKQMEDARPMKVSMNKSLSTDVPNLIVVTNVQESIEQPEKQIEGESRENKKIINTTTEDLQTDDIVPSSISPKISRKEHKNDKLVQNEAKSLLEEISTKKEKFLIRTYKNQTDEGSCKVYDTTEEVPKETDSEDFCVKKCSDIMDQTPKKISSVNEHKLRRNSQRKCKNGVKSNGDEASEKQKQSQIKKISSQTYKLSEKQTINQDYFTNCDDVQQNVIETSSQEFCEKVKPVSQRKLKLQPKRYSKIPQKCAMTRKERRSKRISKKIEDKENLDLNKQLNKCELKIPKSDEIIPEKIACIQTKKLQNAIVVHQLLDQQLKEHNFQNTKTISNNQNQEVSIIEKNNLVEKTENYSKNTIDTEEQENTQNLPITTIVTENNGKQLEENVIVETDPAAIDCETNENHLLLQNLEFNEKTRKVSSQQDIPVKEVENNGKELEENVIVETDPAGIDYETNENHLLLQNLESNEKTRNVSSQQAIPAEEGGLLINFEKLLLEKTGLEPSSANSKRKISQDNHCDETPKNKTRKLAEIDPAEEVNTTATNTNLRKMKKIQKKCRKLYNPDDTYFNAFTRREHPSTSINETTSAGLIQQKEKEIVAVNVGELAVTYEEPPTAIVNEDHVEIENNLHNIEKSASIVLKYLDNNDSKTSMKIASPKRQNRLKNAVLKKPSKIQNSTPERRSLKELEENVIVEKGPAQIDCETNENHLLLQNLESSEKIRKVPSQQAVPVKEVENNGKEFEENVIVEKGPAGIDYEITENHLLLQNLESNEKTRKVSSQQAAPVEEGGLLINFEKLLLENTIPKPSSANSKRKTSQDNHCNETPKNKTRNLSEIDPAEEVNTTATDTNVKKMKKIQRKFRKLYNPDDTCFNAYTRREDPSTSIDETTSASVIGQKEKEIIAVNVGELAVTYKEPPIGIVNEDHAEIENNLHNLEKSASIALKYQNNNDSKTSMKIASPKRQTRLKNVVLKKPSKIQNSTPERSALKGPKKQEEPKKHCGLWDSEFDELMQSLQRTFEQNVDSKGLKKQKDNKYYNNKRKSNSSKYKKLKPLEKQGRTASKEKKIKQNSGHHYKKLHSQVIEHIVNTSVIVLSDSEDDAELQFNVRRAENNVSRPIKIDDHTMKMKTTALLRTGRIDNEDYPVSPTNTAVQPSQISKDIASWVEGATIIEEIRLLKQPIYNIERVVLDIRNTLKQGKSIEE